MGQISSGTASTDGAQLFNLAEDLSERLNLAQQNPKKTEELAGLWNRWNSELPEPAWKPGGTRGATDSPRPTANRSARDPSTTKTAAK
ncbi:MAG TPA: hypothetical protein DCE44_19940 [Verrucomicrobiales bacterium]|nr:hypothetical protein [Verrucomicrobiales bacterium]